MEYDFTKLFAVGVIITDRRGNDINLVKDDKFVTDKYDGYDLSYVAVSYLIDTLGKDNFVKNLDSNDKVNEMSEDIINKSVNYYQNKFANNSNL